MRSLAEIAKRHGMSIKQYPYNQLGKGKPYEGIENLRPESVETVETFMSWQSRRARGSHQPGRSCLFALRRCSFLQHLNQFLVTVGILLVGV